MINFTCPGCQASFQLPDNIAGKSARCSRCSQRFTVPGGESKPTSAPAVAAVRKPAVTSPAKVHEGEVLRKPAGPSPARAARSAPAIDKVDVVEEVEVVDNVDVVDEVEVVDSAISESPRPRKSVRTTDDDDRDLDIRKKRGDGSDDADEDRPRKKKRRKKAGSMGMVLACVGGGVALLIVVVVVILMTTRSTPPANQPGPGGVGPVGVNPGGPNPGGPGPGGPGGKQPAGNAPGAQGTIVLVNGAFKAEDRLTTNDPFDNLEPTHRAKRYNIQLKAGKLYTMEMFSLERFNERRFENDFDPILRIEKDGQPLDEDDDGAGYPHARLSFQAPQNGNYVLVATTFNPHVGRYRLQVREGP